MYLSKNTIALNSRVISLPEFYLKADLTETPFTQMVLTIQDLLINKVGYILCPDAYKQMFLTHSDVLNDFYHDMISYFHDKGFLDLEEIMTMVNVEVIDYDSQLELHEDYLQFYEKTDFSDYPREIIFNGINCIVLYGVNEDDFIDLCFTSLLRKAYMFNEQEKLVLTWFSKHSSELNLYFPRVDEMLINLQFISSHFKLPNVNALEFLKIAIALSGGDPNIIQLPRVTPSTTEEEKKNILAQRHRNRFRLTTNHKILLLSYLEQIEDFSIAYKRKYNNRFIRLGEQLPLHKYRIVYPRAWEHYCRLRNKGKILDSTELLDKIFSKFE